MILEYEVVFACIPRLFVISYKVLEGKNILSRILINIEL